MLTLFFNGVMSGTFFRLEEGFGGLGELIFISIIYLFLSGASLLVALILGIVRRVDSKKRRDFVYVLLPLIMTGGIIIYLLK